MAPMKKGKGPKPVPSPRPSPSVAPAVDRSIIINREGSDKGNSAISIIFNECGRMTVWPASHFSIDRVVIEVRLFADALWAGLVPPFPISTMLYFPIIRST